MKSSLSTIEDEPNLVKLLVALDESEVDAHIDEAFKKIAKEIRLPGFRPGKAPRKVLEARIGKDYARGEAIREALPEYYRKAIIEHDVDVIAPPELDLTSGEEAGAVEFEAVVEVRPQVVVAGYQGLRIEIPALTASDAEIDKQVEQLRTQFSERVEVARAAADTDYVTMDIGGTHEGEPVEGLSAEDYTYEVGAGFVVDELDDHLRGAKVGDIVEFDAAHPDPDEDGELSFRVLVKKIEEKQLPDLDDAFASEASEFETADELIADTRQRLEEGKKSQANQLVADRTASALAQLVDTEIPEALVQDQIQRQLQDMAMRLAQQGMQIDQFLEATGQSVEDLAENMKEPAEQAARVDLALRAVVAAESMELTDDELQAEIDESAAQLGQDGAELRQAFEEGGQLSSLRSDILKQRAMDLLMESVEIVDEDGNTIDRADIEPVAESDDAESAPEQDKDISASAEPEPTEAATDATEPSADEGDDK